MCPLGACRVPEYRLFGDDAAGSFADAGVADGAGAAFFLEPRK